MAPPPRAAPPLLTRALQSPPAAALATLALEAVVVRVDVLDVRVAAVDAVCARGGISRLNLHHGVLEDLEEDGAGLLVKCGGGGGAGSRGGGEGGGRLGRRRVRSCVEVRDLVCGVLADATGRPVDSAELRRCTVPRPQLVQVRRDQQDALAARVVSVEVGREASERALEAGDGPLRCARA
jgi:hypothetical protein